MNVLVKHWRPFIARLPLPALALAASYGVYSFNLLFVPVWVALVSAAAFELTYVGLAVSEVSTASRKRASIIAGSAVGVSIVYNTLAGLFHRRPDLLVNPELWIDATLAVLHGLPLAIVAYNVAQLLLHTERPVEAPAPRRLAPVLAQAAPDPVARVSIAEPRPCPNCGADMDSADWRVYRSAESRGARFNGCKACKEL